MASPVSGLTLANNLYLKNLDRPDVQEAIINTGFNYNKVQVITNKISGGAAPIKTPNLNVKVPILAKQGISNLLTANAAQSGLNLVITFPGTENRYRLKDLVRDSAGTYGKVIAVAGNTVTIEPAGVGAVLTAGTHFKSGYYVVNAGNVSGNGTTTGLSSLSVTPEYDYALLMKIRDTNSMNLQDAIKTEIIWKGNGKYWFHSQQMLMMNRFARTREYNYVYSDREENVPSALEGAYNRTGGIRWTAKNNGGTYMPLNATITEQDLKDFITAFGKKTGDAHSNILLLCGRDAMAAIQSFLSPYVYQAGTQNLFGGADLKGFDIQTYSFNGGTLNITHYPMFDDSSLGADYLSTINGISYTSQQIMALNLTPAESANGMGMVPAIQRYVPESAPSMSCKFIEGLGLWDSAWNANLGSDWAMAQSDVDASSWECWSLEGIFCIPERVGWIDLVS